MKSRRIVGTGWLGALLWGGVWLWAQDPAVAQPPPRDVGLITAVSGEVQYQGHAQAVGRAEPFMKVRLGDRFELAKEASLQIVFFQGSRQELWRGPVSFKAGEAQGEPLGGGAGAVEVKVLPAGTGQGIQRVPALLRRAGLSRVGGMQVRGSGAKAQEGERPAPTLSEEEKAELQAARETYKTMREKASPEDLTPELFFLGVLSEYEQYEEMESLLKEALSKDPGNELLKSLAGWVKTQGNKPR